MQYSFTMVKTYVLEGIRASKFEAFVGEKGSYYHRVKKLLAIFTVSVVQRIIRVGSPRLTKSIKL